MRITIAKKLWLSFGILIFVLGVSGSISYLQIHELNRALKEFLSVQEPLENALLEMEVNIGETAISILAFVRDGNVVRIRNLRQSQERFGAFLEEFNALAETVPEKEFGRKAIILFSNYEELSKKIITLAAARTLAQKKFTTLAEQTSVTIDQSLSTPNKGIFKPSIKSDSAIRMKLSFHRIFSAITHYVAQRQPRLKTEISKAEKDFIKWKDIYARSALSPSATVSLNEIGHLYEKTVASGMEAVAITDQLGHTLEHFEKDLLRIRDLLNNHIQPLMREETEDTADKAIYHGGVALSVTIGMALFVLVTMGVVTWVTTRGIIRSVRQLKEGSDIFGGGDLDHRIETTADDELKDVASAFNQMAEKRKAAEMKVQESAEKIKLFSYSISHDLKSPAIGIHGLAILLQKQSEQLLDEKGKTHLRPDR
jgi:methyl-accepting chemotaxis protein